MIAAHTEILEQVEHMTHLNIIIIIIIGSTVLCGPMAVYGLQFDARILGI
jgi:hypothetical protein